MLEPTIHWMHKGGRDLDDHLQRLIAGTHSFATWRDARDAVRLIKSRLGYVSQDFVTEMNADPELHELEMPDGTKLTVTSHSVIRGTEAMFQPAIAGWDLQSLPEVCYWRCIRDSPPELQQELLQNIVCSGGNSLFPGFDTRLEAEIKRLAPVGAQVKLVGPPETEMAVSPSYRERLHAFCLGRYSPNSPSYEIALALQKEIARHLPAYNKSICHPARLVMGWNGASIMSSLSSFSSSWITFADYEEHGPRLAYLCR